MIGKSIDNNTKIPTKEDEGDENLSDGLNDNQTSQNTKNISRKRSSKGCITCKIRKKRCDEVKPICGDCKRLNRKCAYITDEMSNDQIKILKEEMKLIEKCSKARKRKKKMPDDEKNDENISNITNISGISLRKKIKINSNNHKSNHSSNNKVVFNPLAMTMASMTNSANSVIFQTLSTSNAPTTLQSTLIPDNIISFQSNNNNNINVKSIGQNIHDKRQHKSKTKAQINYASSSAQNNLFSQKHITQNNENQIKEDVIKPDFNYGGGNIDNTNINTVHNNNSYRLNNNNNNSNNNFVNTAIIQSISSPNFKPNFNQLQYLSSLSPTLDVSTVTPNFSQDNQNSTSTSFAPSPIPPLSLNGEENPTSFVDLFSNGFPKLLQDHFKAETSSPENNNNNNNSSNSNVDNNYADQFTQIQDMFKFSPRFQPKSPSENLITEISNNKELSITNCNNNNNIYNNNSGNNNNNNSKNSNDDNDNHINSLINNTGNNGENCNNSYNNFKKIDNIYDNSTDKLTSMIQSYKSPQIYTNPSIVLNSTLANLTPIGKKLYEYYRDRLSFVVSSAPKTENMYLNTFLPMAHIDKSVLYGILAWSSFHLGMEKQGNYYIKSALEGVFKRPILDEEVKGNIQLICDEVDVNDNEIIREPENDDDNEIYEDLELSRLNRDNMINLRLAAFLILCGVEICKGDVSKWSKYLTYGAKLIKLKGGLERFNESKDEHFLVTNYAYHDITAIQVINERTIHFDINDYEKMWTKSNELGFSDPLHGISSPVFKILAEINKLVITVQKLIRRTMKHDNEFNQNDLTKNLADSPEEKIYGLDEEDYWAKDEEYEKSSIASSSIDDIFLNGIPSTVSDEWIDDDFEKEVVLEDFDQVILECQNIEQRIAEVRPEISPGVSNKDLELQLTMFECFQVTTKIHLRQSVLRMNSASIEIQYLTTQLIKLLDVLLGSDVEACLCFPMFTAGLNSVRKNDRIDMNKRFEEFIKRYKWRNVARCQLVIKYVWKLNCKGEKFVDWYAVVKKLGWDLSFA